MANNIAPRPLVKQARKTPRQLTAWQLVRRCRLAGFTQWEIAKRAGVSQGTVASTIHRRNQGPAQERVWAVLEEILA